MEGAIAQILKFSSQVLEVGQPIPSIIEYEKFEQKYKLKLPKEYKFLVSRFNGLSLMGVEILGIHDGGESLGAVYEFEHEATSNPMPAWLIPFSPDGGGNFYCFDTKNLSTDGGRCPIVFWQWDMDYDEKNPPEVVYPGMTEWILEVMVDWVLEQYDHDGNPL